MALTKSSRLTKVLLSTVLLAATAARASEGGVAGGGGNTLHGHLIETYAGHSVHELKGYDAAIAKLRALVPTFAELQSEQMSTKTIYLIPESFGALPLRATELDFQTDLPCYQTKDEIFCNPEKLDGMTTDEQKELFIHEAVMNARLAVSGDGAPSIGDLRTVVAVLLKPNVTDVQAVNILSARNFGTFVTAKVYANAERYRTAVEKSNIGLCRLGRWKWDNTNTGNPLFNMQTQLERILNDDGDGQDISYSWMREDAFRFANETVDAGAFDFESQQRYCDGLLKKYHTH